MAAVLEVARKLSEQHPQLTLTVQLDGSVLVLLGGKEQSMSMLPWEDPPHVACIRALHHPSRGASSRLPGAAKHALPEVLAMLPRCSQNLGKHDGSFRMNSSA